MMRFLRRHRNTLMIVIAILAIPFIFYFNKTDFSARGLGDLATMYDRKISIVEAQRYGRLHGLANALGMTDFVQSLTAGARDENEQNLQFIFNLIILRHESERLGIQPGPSEIVELVRKMPTFQNPSGFDMKKYTEFTQEILSPNGFTEAQIEELGRDELCLKRIKEVVAMSVSVPESEAKESFEQAYGKFFVSVIRLKRAEFLKDITVNDEDIQKYYDSHKGEVKSDEKRKVEFANLSLSDEQKKLTGKERIEALQKLADRATDFTQALLEKGADFHQVAAKFQTSVQVTGEFTVAKTDPKFGPEGQLGTAAFQLTEQEPNSEPVQVADGYSILHLVAIVPSRQLTLEEAKPRIVDAIKASRAREALTTKGANVSRELREGLKAGEPLSFAAERVAVKAETVPPFTLMDDLEQEEQADQNKNKDKDKAKDKGSKPADMLAIKNAAATLDPGDVSEFFPWEDGGIITVVEKREPPDEKKFADKKKDLDERIKHNKREVVFYEWLREKQRDAGLLNDKTETGPPKPAKKS